MTSCSCSVSRISKKRKVSQQSQTQIPSKNRKPIITILPYLPTPILFEILSRVPIKTLFNCLLVCKSWADLISTPEFAELHLSRLPTSCLIKCLYKERIGKCLSKGLHLVDPECQPYSLHNKLGFVPGINLPSVPLVLLNSCNGLVCLSQLIHPEFSDYSYKIYVCNPVLRQYITIKPPDVAPPIFYSYSCAFGFSHKTNEYKVVLSSSTNNGNYPTEIYTLGEGLWRSIENAPCAIGNHNFNTVLNGALHWLPFGHSTPFICCFDFVTEQFHAVPEPYEFGPRQKKFSHRMQLGVINGNLSLCDSSKRNRITLWVMKEYGAKESWSKDIVITRRIYVTDFGAYEPIMTMGNGKILVIFQNRSFMLYDPKSEAFESESDIFGVSSEFRAVAHVPSLISLKDVAKGENLKVLGSN